MSSDSPANRSRFLLKVFREYVEPEWSILEIGSGDGRNIHYLKAHGYHQATGIDREEGTSIETIPEQVYDVIFTMSCLFLLPRESEWVFEKIARMTKRYLITVEGETTKTELGLIGRDYNDIFSHLGLIQVQHTVNVFNQYGHLRVFKKL